jgi:glycosyltransferase involved in cell wall biosynthesis
MKIVYLLAEDLSRHPGLRHKIDYQIGQWVAAGHEVYKVLHFSGVVEEPSGRSLMLEPKLSAAIKPRGKARQLLRLSRQYAFASAALKRIQPDITYSRYVFPAWGVGHVAKQSGRLVLEINSNDASEYYLKSPLTGVFNKAFRGGVLRMAKGLVFVTRELAHASAFSAFTKSRAVIANGVECMHFPFRLNPANASPQLGFIGSPGQPWHGLDKLQLLAELLVDCTVHVIGPGEQECRSLWGRVPPNVVMHGYLGEIEAQRLMAMMDVGISTLALHRKKMDEACPLKVRQYLAQGLPVIAASEDTDILSDQNFYLRLPNSEDNIFPHAKRIADFVRLAFGNIAMREEARKFAMNKMAVEGKEEERLRFFESILEAS